MANYFFEGLRAKQGCAANTTVLQAAVAPRFVPAADVMGGPARAATCKALASTPALPAPPLDPDTCFLLSRKWPAYLAGSVYRLFTDCSDRLGMLRPDVCRAAPPFQPPKRQPHPISAELPQPEVLPASPSACNQVGRARAGASSRQLCAPAPMQPYQTASSACMRRALLNPHPPIPPLAGAAPAARGAALPDPGPAAP